MSKNRNSIKIYWNTANNFNQKANTTNFFDYMKQRLETNYIETNEELNKTYKFINHNEYNLFNYFKFLFEYYQYSQQPNNLIFVADELVADIKILSVESQTIILENTKNKKQIKFGIEYDTPIPYLTGIYKYSEKTILFDCTNVKRTYLLSYIGGSWRGPYNQFGQAKRYITIKNFTEISNNNLTKYNKHLFFCPLLANSHLEEGHLGWSEGSFGIKAKDVYWNSVFSWQPSGDTPTRRAFYEAILLGNIPVISESCFMIYKNLLIGDENVESMVVILDDNDFFDANYVINYLLTISDDEILERRSNINKLYHRLQWGPTLNKNALSDIIDAMLE
jgi:hypothetical protein